MPQEMGVEVVRGSVWNPGCEGDFHIGDVDLERERLIGEVEEWLEEDTRLHGSPAD
jgi:hypothetical protein